MEGWIAGILVVSFLLLYGGLAGAVGLLARHWGWSFLLFFLLALFFNPVLVAFGLVLLQALTQGTESDTLAGGAREVAEKGAEAVQGRDLSEEMPGPPEAGAGEAPPPSEEAGASGGGPDGGGEEAPSETGPGGEGDATSGADTVQCDVCHSRVDAAAAECPACGSPLDDDSLL
jgi:hypothetical protein